MFSLFIVSWTVVSLAYLSKIMCSKVPTSLVIYRFIQDDHSRKLIKHSLFFCFPVTWSNVIHALIFFHSRFSIHTWIGCWHCMPRMSSPAHLKTSRCYIKHNLILLCFPSLFMFQGKLVYHLVEKQWLKNIQRSLTVSLIQTCRVKTSYTVGLKMARMLHQTHGPQSLLPVPCLSNQPAKPIPVCTSALRKHLTQVAWLPTLGPKYSWMFNVSNGWSNFAHLIYFFLSSSWSGSVCWFKMNIWLTRYFDDFRFISFISDTPTIVEMQDTVAVPEGSDARLPCISVGNPSTSFTNWTRLGEDLRSRSRFAVLEKGSLLIQDVRRTDAGEYACTPYNKVGPGETKITRLVLKGKNSYKSLWQQSCSRPESDVFPVSILSQLFQSLLLHLQVSWRSEWMMTSHWSVKLLLILLPR